MKTSVRTGALTLLLAGLLLGAPAAWAATVSVDKDPPVGYSKDRIGGESGQEVGRGEINPSGEADVNAPTVERTPAEPSAPPAAAQEPAPGQAVEQTESNTPDSAAVPSDPGRSGASLPEESNSASYIH